MPRHPDLNIFKLSWVMFVLTEYLTPSSAKTARPLSPIYWLIEDKNNQDPLGIQSITALKGLLSVFEFGIILAADAEGKGYAYEALLAMIDYAFTILGHDILVETHQANNLSVCKLAERLGFKSCSYFQSQSD